MLLGPRGRASVGGLSLLPHLSLFQSVHRYVLTGIYFILELISPALFYFVSQIFLALDWELFKLTLVSL